MINTVNTFCFVGSSQTCIHKLCEWSIITMKVDKLQNCFFKEQIKMITFFQKANHKALLSKVGIYPFCALLPPQMTGTLFKMGS